jgi:hypothetical protein
MENNSDYVKDIEKYFLSLAGEGIMLSSMDYNLILDWKKKEIPKEVVFKGINRAFVEGKSRDGQGPKSVRNLKHCAQYIENSIIEFRPIIGKNLNRAESLDDDSSIDIAVERLNNYIKSEKEDITKSYYINLKEKLLASIDINGNNALSLSPKIEEESLEELFGNLSEAEKLEISLEAESKLGNRGRHMTEAALEESLVSFRNEILSNKYRLKGLLSNAEEYDG